MAPYRIPYADWGNAEAIGALRGLVAPPGRMSSALEARAQQMFPGRIVHAVNAGRTALAMILNAFKGHWPSRSEVVVPAYICPSVIETIRRCGLSVRFADVDATLNVTEAAVVGCLSPRTLTVLAVHMYGKPAPIQALEVVCAAHGIPMIDDAAQVVGVTIGARPLGSFGDAGLVSFAQSKTIVTGLSGAGGLLIASDAWKERLTPMIEALSPNERGISSWIGFLWSHVLERLSERPRRYTACLHTGEKVGATITAARIASVPAAVALAQFARLPMILSGKRRALAAYASGLGRRPHLTLPQYIDGLFLTRAMILLPEGSDSLAVRRQLQLAGVRSRLPYPLPPDLPPNECKQAMSLHPQLLELPIPRDLTQHRACEILDRLDSALAASTRAARLVRRPVPPRARA